ncbi:hypothetical protein H0R92_11835 [Treponema sp. OMZ 840]|uniref:hypothetical protein n=1 Tax=Treponema sp. OMZ 840 TaxID=244313 RepID=UPI003D8A5DDD
MNKKSNRVWGLRFIGFVAVLIFVFISLSCKSVQGAPNGQSTEQSADPAFLGDFDPIRLEDAMALRLSFGKIKPTQIRLYFVPRTNVVEAHLRDGMNSVVLMFDAQQRRSLAEGIDLYAQAYALYAAGNKSALPERKADRKNAFNRGGLSVAWGVLGTARTAHTEFRTNYEFLEKGKPYFVLTAEGGEDMEDSTVQSPLVHLYFSPAQLEALSEITRQDALQKHIDVLNEKAFAF